MDNFEEINQDNTQTAPQEQTQNNAAGNENSELIMGKFKSVDDLSNAYKNMETKHGQQSKELGELRKKAEILDKIQKQVSDFQENNKAIKEYIDKNAEKYNKDEYLKNPEFNNLYKEALIALGTNLDTDKFVSLLDSYVNSRISMYEKNQSAKSETENSKSQMQFSDSSPKAASKAIPKLDTLDDAQIDEVIAKYI